MTSLSVNFKRWCLENFSPVVHKYSLSFLLISTLYQEFISVKLGLFTVLTTSDMQWYMCFWDDVEDPEPTAAGCTTFLRCLDAAKIGIGQCEYQLPVGVQKRQLLEKKLLHLKRTNSFWKRDLVNSLDSAAPSHGQPDALCSRQGERRGGHRERDLVSATLCPPQQPQLLPTLLTQTWPRWAKACGGVFWVSLLSFYPKSQLLSSPVIFLNSTNMRSADSNVMGVRCPHTPFFEDEWVTGCLDQGV